MIWKYLVLILTAWTTFNMNLQKFFQYTDTSQDEANKRFFINKKQVKIEKTEK